MHKLYTYSFVLSLSVPLRTGCVCVRWVRMRWRLDRWELRLSRLHSNLPVNQRPGVQRAGQVCVWQVCVWWPPTLWKLLREMSCLPKHLPIILVLFSFCSLPQSMMETIFTFNTDKVTQLYIFCSVSLSGSVWTATCLMVSRKKRRDTATTLVPHWWATWMM